MENIQLNPNKIPHALIVKIDVLVDFDSFLTKYLKILICSKHGCNVCNWCKKIDNRNYYDLIVLNAKNGIKKNQILEIINRFSKTGIESVNIKVYVIENIEYATSKVLNSLLKFLEEPPSNVYCVFTTKNYNAILPTIKSRCQTIFLKKNLNIINDFFTKEKTPEHVKKIIVKCFYDFNDLKNNYSNFLKFYDLINNLNSNHYLEYINNGLQLFKKMPYQNINLFIEICKCLFKDVVLELINIQNKLYLNINKTLIFSMICDLIRFKK